MIEDKKCNHDNHGSTEGGLMHHWHIRHGGTSLIVEGVV
jgi:hypothetical protein